MINGKPWGLIRWAALTAVAGLVLCRTGAAAEMAGIPAITLDRVLSARAPVAVLEWTPDSAILISLQVRLLDGWFRLQTPTGHVLHEYVLPSAATYHEIVSTRDVIMPGDSRKGLAFTVEDVATGKTVFQQMDPAPDAPGSASGAVRFSLSMDRSVLAVGYGWPRSGQPVTLYDTGSWQPLKTLSVPADAPLGVGGMRMSRDGARLAYTGSRGLLVVELESGAVIGRMPVQYPGEFAFSPDGRLLAVEELDMPTNQMVSVPRAVSVFRVSDGAVIASLKLDAHSGVTSLEWEPQGRFVVFIGGGRTVHVWNPATVPAKELVIPLGSAARNLALSPDGKQMAVGDGDTIKLFAISN